MIFYVNGTPVKVTAESSLKNAGILTEEEFEALPSEEKNSGLWILPGVSSSPIGSGGSLDFSTEEKVVGTWIDGKPIYRKTVLVTFPDKAPFYGEKLYQFDNDLEAIVGIDVITKNHVAGTENMTYYASNVQLEEPYRTGIAIAQEDVSREWWLLGWSYHAQYANAELSVTVRYTKTTDEGVTE